MCDKEEPEYYYINIKENSNYNEERLHIQNPKGHWIAYINGRRIALLRRPRSRGRNLLPEEGEAIAQRQRSLETIVGPSQIGLCSGAWRHLLDS